MEKEVEDVAAQVDLTNDDDGDDDDEANSVTQIALTSTIEKKKSTIEGGISYLIINMRW